eukprot:CAMPEP_0113413198 /NCGR_PEP_ID=MMETSP0013_2-20120614/23284_1 /TAXON_ID=2843 ORGANISM="Skeletonema costatum, Strain 1716" /NCGR_SAMPLE_ID=MMETSP0013_2 /ASSEMBLY_ACC=CAM_ASM_000158 /LENGTH=249 /DNA_ID=CAMNT_0000299829 /DNA_START=28 /DNA_END=777 /DNA_ORIENTATION=- /assembly_acc=CAM_ASM_000158
MPSIFKRKKKKQAKASAHNVLATEASNNWEMSNGSLDERDESPGGKGSKKNIKRGKDCNVRSRDGVPIITSDGADHFAPSFVSGKNNYAVSGFYTKQKDHNGANRPRVRPAASKSAFGGAPRYDWMDIETTAAIKVQAAWRRVRTQIHLDRAGISTPGMRNRQRQRNARQKARMRANAEDVPFPFNMCGMGLLFGDATLEDQTVIDDMERRKLRKEKEQFEMEEERRRKFRMRKKSSGNIEEEIEVVDY